MVVGARPAPAVLHAPGRVLPPQQGGVTPHETLDSLDRRADRAGLARPGHARSRSPRDDGFDTAAFGKLPVLVGGRIKPFDTVARNSLLIINGKQVLRQDGRKTGATRWLLDVLFDARKPPTTTRSS